jgi:peptidoglycan/LPS O-acetylase OafA/YrhL
VNTLDYLYNDMKRSTHEESKIHRDRLLHSSIIYGLISLADESELNPRCYNNLITIRDAIHHKEIWAIKLLDSSAQKESGFIFGHNNWIGSPKECESVQEPLYITLSDRYHRTMKPDLIQSVAPFDVEYRMVYAKHHSPWQVEVKFMLENMLHIGLCLPKSCTNNEVFNLTRKYFNNRLIDVQVMYEIDADVVHVKDMKLSHDFYYKKTLWLLCGILAVTGLLTLLSYINEEKVNELSNENNNNNNNNDLTTKTTQCSQKTFYEKLLDSFSVRKNWQTIADDSISPDSIPVIGGLKTISCYLILTFHMLWFSYYTIDNRGIMFHYAEQVQFQVIANAPLLVDMFFVISGFLVTYNFLRNKLRMDEIKNNSFRHNAKLFGKLLLHRYIRLSPLYLLITLMSEVGMSYVVDTSKFWVHQRYDQTCQRYWWRNLLYIQNLFHADDLCVCWSWSLACDMQYYIIFTLILFIYAKNKKAGINCFIGFSALIVAISTWSIFKNKFIPTWDVVYNTGTQLYIAPWVRILPYLIGVGCGYYLYNYKNTFNVSKRNSQFLWITSCVFLSAILHCTIYREIPIWVTYCILMFGRLFASLAASWFIVASVCGEANWFSNFLSARIFVLINKLTYAIYLLNPLLIFFLFSQVEHGTSVDPVSMTILTIGISFITTVAAIGFSLFFELPYYKLSNQILKKSATPKKVN